MKKVMITGATIAALSIFLNSTNYLYTNPIGAPAARTGAPRATSGTESTCASSGCHGGNLNVGPNSAGITITGNPATFDPGATYTITPKINTPTGSAGGFQMVVLNPARTSTGTLTAGTTSRVVSASGRAYMTHSNKNNRSWSFTWNAPTTNVPDSVTFYLACMETVGGAYHTYTTTKVFYKTVNTTRVEEVVKEEGISVFPTFVSEKLTVKTPHFGQVSTRIQVLGIDGKEYLNQNMDVAAEQTEVMLPATMKPGPYIVRLLKPDGIQIRRIVKL